MYAKDPCVNFLPKPVIVKTDSTEDSGLTSCFGGASGASVSFTTGDGKPTSLVYEKKCLKARILSNPKFLKGGGGW